MGGEAGISAIAEHMYRELVMAIEMPNYACFMPPGGGGVVAHVSKSLGTI